MTRSRKSISENEFLVMPVSMPHDLFLLRWVPETCQFPTRNDDELPFFGVQGGFHVVIFDVSCESEAGGFGH